MNAPRARNRREESWGSLVELIVWAGSGWSGTCPSGGDNGLQRMLLRLAAPTAAGGLDLPLAVVVRNPCTELTDAGC